MCLAGSRAGGVGLPKSFGAQITLSTPDTTCAAGGVTVYLIGFLLCVGLIVPCYAQFLHFEIRILTLCHDMLEVCDYFCL